MNTITHAVDTLQRTALILALALCSPSFASAGEADEYVLEILFENGLAETTAVPGEIVRAELWITIPIELGLAAYDVTVGVEHTTPPAVIVAARGTPTRWVFQMGGKSLRDIPTR